PHPFSGDSLMAQEALASPSVAAQPATRPARTRSAGVRDANHRMASGLGWFSIALGLAQIVAPRALARMIGVRPNPATLRLVGIREITAGVGLLTAPEAPGWRWARVAGDLMDLA